MDEKDIGPSACRTVRISGDELRETLDDLDRAEALRASGSELDSFSYRPKSLIVKMSVYGTSALVRFQVIPRRIGARGLAFIHGGFIHPGTFCKSNLVTTYGTWIEVEGTVLSCEYVSKNLHDVFVSFYREIDPAAFCDEAIRRNVLLVDNDDLVARIATVHLAKLNARCVRVPSGRRCLEVANSDVFDLVLLDWYIDGNDGIETIRSLRGTGYTGYVCGMGADVMPSHVEEFIEAGCDRFIGKPFVRKDLAELLAALRQEPLYSTEQDNPDFVEPLRVLISCIPDRISRIAQAMRARDEAGLLREVRDLKVCCSMYGFDCVSDRASAAESILATDGFEAAKDAVDRLLWDCQRMRATTRKAVTQ